MILTFILNLIYLLFLTFISILPESIFGITGSLDIPTYLLNAWTTIVSFLYWLDFILPITEMMVILGLSLWLQLALISWRFIYMLWGMIRGFGV